MIGPRARRVWERLRRLRDRDAATASDTRHVADPADLEARLDRCEREIQELRTLGVRVAELADLVTELLALAAARDDPAFREAVERYRREV